MNDELKLERELAVSQAQVKEIRSALGDDGRRTHKEILEMAFKASGWKVWKDKYIDLRNAHIAEGQDPAGTIWEHADKLQKELKEAKAEIAKLNHQLLKTESDLLQSQDINSFLEAEFGIACNRAGKAEAESESRRQSLAFALNEIKKSEAEAELYKKSVKAYVHACEPIRGMADKLGLRLGECIIQHGVPLLLESHKKAVAEVERLRELLNLAIEIADNLKKYAQMPLTSDFPQIAVDSLMSLKAVPYLANASEEGMNPTL
jgi:hypothetical protein